ncbi:MAG: IS1 family transposase [Actinomycetota bacterium]
MNRLSTERRAQIVASLVEGNPIRATCRMTGAAKNTVTNLLVALGDACSAYMGEVMVNLPCKTLEADEIWAFCHSKAKNVPPEHQGEFGYGDVWTWTALDADTKLVPSFMIGGRGARDAYAFMTDLAGRLANRVQLTTDGHAAYLVAVKGAFGDDIDYAQLQKIYGEDPVAKAEKRYSPAQCLGADVRVVSGDPNPWKISTSYVERQNLTMRMGMRRFTRLTNGFSKKVENLAAAVALHFLHYNFARPHATLSDPYPTTPAMAVGVADHVWPVEEIVKLIHD